MLTFSFSGELPLNRSGERDQLILSVMDSNALSTAGQALKAHLPDYGLPDLSLIHQGMAAGRYGLMRRLKKRCCVMNHA